MSSVFEESKEYFKSKLNKRTDIKDVKVTLKSIHDSKRYYNLYF